MDNNKRLLKNTMFSYGKMFISIFVALYSTKIVLKELGESDYGLYNVIAGLVTLFSVISTTMATGTLRNLTYAIGNNNVKLFKINFSSSMIIHLLLAILTFLLLELVGNYLLYNELNIDTEKIGVASVLLQFVIISTVLTVISIPYSSLIIANEDLHINSIFGIIDTFINLLIAIIIQFNFGIDKLIVFGILTLFRTLVGIFLKVFYSFKKYNILKNIRIFSDYRIYKIKELLFFSFWKLLGVITYTLKTQGVTVVLNIFFGTVINAAYAITNQINGQLQMFSYTILEVTQPQIVKSESVYDFHRQKKLLYLSSEMMFMILSIVSLPFIINANFLLKIWLVDYPKETVNFIFLVIIITLIKQFTHSIEMIAIAKNKVKNFQLLNFTFQILIIPIGYILFKNEYSVYSIFQLIILIEFLSLVQSSFFLNKYTKINAMSYFFGIVIKNFIVLIFLYYINCFVYDYLKDFVGILPLFFLTCLFSLLSSLFLFFIFMNKEVRESILFFINKKIKIKCF